MEAKERSELQRQADHLYCVASYLDSTFGSNDSLPPNIQISQISINKTRLRAIFGVLSHECKSSIKALSLKQHLQEYLFNEADKTNKVIKTSYSILVYLQTMAELWNNIEFINHSYKCVSLTETEYKMMYFVHYDSKDSLHSTLKTSAANWFDIKNYKKYLKSSGAPRIETCDTLYPSLNIF